MPTSNETLNEIVEAGKRAHGDEANSTEMLDYQNLADLHADQLAAELLRRQWRPIETAPFNQNVLVATKRRQICFAIKDKNPRGIIHWWAYGMTTLYGDEEPTHWQPLPAPPDEARELVELLTPDKEGT
jgi:hypothetical protein